jgi:hypothetical protein
MMEQQLFEAAKQLITLRYPTGFGGAAAIATESGRILTSVAPDTKNDSLSLCMEVGAEREQQNTASSRSLLFRILKKLPHPAYHHPHLRHYGDQKAAANDH